MFENLKQNCKEELCILFFHKFLHLIIKKSFVFYMNPLIQPISVFKFFLSPKTSQNNNDILFTFNRFFKVRHKIIASNFVLSCFSAFTENIIFVHFVGGLQSYFI